MYIKYLNELYVNSLAYQVYELNAILSYQAMYGVLIYSYILCRWTFRTHGSLKKTEQRLIHICSSNGVNILTMQLKNMK